MLEEEDSIEESRTDQGFIKFPCSLNQAQLWLDNGLISPNTQFALTRIEGEWRILSVIKKMKEMEVRPEEEGLLRVLQEIKQSLPDSPVEIEKTELYKLPLGDKIDFTIKSHLTDATFIVEGKKIYAGSDFLSIHSPYFKILLTGNSFADSKTEGIELKDVTYEGFHTMLQCLSDYSSPYYLVNTGNAESLLCLGDRFDIKHLTDKVEQFLTGRNEFSVSEKLLLSDKYRLMKLQIMCFDLIGKKDKQCLSAVKNSKEFNHLSDSAKQIINGYEAESHHYDYQEFVDEDEVEIVEEPTNGFIAKGLLAIRAYIRSDERSQNIPSRTIELAGLLWTVKEKYGDKDENGCRHGVHISSLSLELNMNLSTTVNWNVKGFVEMEMYNVHIDELKKKMRTEKKYAFSFDNSNRICRVKIDGKSLHEEYSEMFLAHFTIYIEEISGVRKNSKFDFVDASDFSDAAFIVEGRKIHVNKQYLSTISPRFSELFYESNEVKLNNVKYEDFIVFLHWIYPTTGKGMTGSSIISFFLVAEKLKVNIDKSSIYNYLADTAKEVLFVEKMFLYFQFNFGEERWLVDSWWSASEDSARSSYELIKRSELYNMMTTDKQLLLTVWVLDRV